MARARAPSVLRGPDGVDRLCQGQDWSGARPAVTDNGSYVAYAHARESYYRLAGCDPATGHPTPPSSAASASTGSPRKRPRRDDRHRRRT